MQHFMKILKIYVNQRQIHYNLPYDKQYIFDLYNIDLKKYIAGIIRGSYAEKYSR